MSINYKIFKVMITLLVGSTVTSKFPLYSRLPPLQIQFLDTTNCTVALKNKTFKGVKLIVA